MVLGPMNKNGGGQIVCVSSCLGLRPTKKLAAYSSTKSFLTFISYCIDREYKNINVQILIPAVVATSMTYYNSKETMSARGLFERIFVISPAKLAREAIRTIGLTKFTTGSFVHEMQLLVQYLPVLLQEFILELITDREDRRVLKLLEDEKERHKDSKIRSVAA
ncbi:unnamed protein product [Enterobius vermicularis]|uniref:Corticosteroid 11-beta-dehydrogenase n=1 Tax=Enterobius vermicularis TaxID=51028 RepID=A0A0N4VM58_ENTVE|nr:unnamed protein product [Enterobius vermicularis]